MINDLECLPNIIFVVLTKLCIILRFCISLQCIVDVPVFDIGHPWVFNNILRFWSNCFKGATVFSDLFIIPVNY